MTDADQALALQPLLRLQPEDVVAQRRPERLRELPGLQAQDGPFDVLGQLPPLERAEIAAVLGAGVPRVLPGQLGEIGTIGELGA